MSETSQQTAISRLIYRLGLPSTAAVSHSVIRALTHSSWYIAQGEKDSVGNSREIFLGMFYFKGRAARLMYQYKAVRGQQLQHDLGNMFSLKKMNQKFEDWKLDQLARASGIDLSKHKHIFAFGLLGCLATLLDDAQLDRFIIRHFISDGVMLLDEMKYDKLRQLEYLAFQRYEDKLKIELSETGGKYVCTILCGNNTLASQISRSKIYARQGAVLKALKNILDKNDSELKENPVFLWMQEQQKAEKNKLKKAQHGAYLESQRQKAQDRKDKKIAEALQKQEKEKERQKAKAKRKASIQEQEHIKALKASKGISASKRRFLEDKQK